MSLPAPNQLTWLWPRMDPWLMDVRSVWTTLSPALVALVVVVVAVLVIVVVVVALVVVVDLAGLAVILVSSPTCCSNAVLAPFLLSTRLGTLVAAATFS